jgi:hypothetical protein
LACHWFRTARNSFPAQAFDFCGSSFSSRTRGSRCPIGFRCHTFGSAQLVFSVACAWSHFCSARAKVRPDRPGRDFCCHPCPRLVLVAGRSPVRSRAPVLVFSFHLPRFSFMVFRFDRSQAQHSPPNFYFPFRVKLAGRCAQSIFAATWSFPLVDSIYTVRFPLKVVLGCSVLFLSRPLKIFYYSLYFYGGFLIMSIRCSVKYM